MQFAEQVSWIKPLGAYYALGLDGIGLTLVLLVVIVTPVVIIASWRDFDSCPASAEPPRPRGLPCLPRAEANGSSTGAGRELSMRADVSFDGLRTCSFDGLGRDPLRAPEAHWPPSTAQVFFALVLAVETCALFLFLATDVFLFYVFFEVILIPMYFLIGGFGPGPRRTYAAAKFLIFGLLGGFVMLASVIGLYVQSAKAGRAELSAQHAEPAGHLRPAPGAGCSSASCSPSRSRRRWCRCTPGCPMPPRSPAPAAPP